MHLTAIICLITLIQMSLEARVDSSEVRLVAKIDGNLTIGVLLPIHYPPNNIDIIDNQEIKCLDVREEYGIQRVEAVFYAIDRINGNNTLLPGLTLGVEIRDDCWYAPVTIQQTLELIKDVMPTVCQSNSSINLTGQSKSKDKGLIGVVGPGSSSSTIEVIIFP